MQNFYVKREDFQCKKVFFFTLDVFKDGLDVVLSLILDAKCLLIGMACATKKQLQNFNLL